MTIHYLERPTGKIAYDDAGGGPLVICVPSMGDLRGEFRFLAPQIVAAGYRFISMDVRGHGDTSITWSDYSISGIGSDLVALIHSLNAGPAVIIGTSMAAGAAIWADRSARTGIWHGFDQPLCAWWRQFAAQPIPLPALLRTMGASHVATLLF